MKPGPHYTDLASFTDLMLLLSPLPAIFSLCLRLLGPLFLRLSRMVESGTDLSLCPTLPPLCGLRQVTQPLQASNCPLPNLGRITQAHVPKQNWALGISSIGTLSRLRGHPPAANTSEGSIPKHRYLKKSSEVSLRNSQVHQIRATEPALPNWKENSEWRNLSLQQSFASYDLINSYLPYSPGHTFGPSLTGPRTTASSAVRATSMHCVCFSNSI